MPNANKVTIVAIGSSVRACAESIQRAGYQAVGYDRFADRHDRNKIQLKRAAIDSATVLKGIINTYAGSKIIVTGPLENEPDTISLIDRLCVNLGTPASSLPQLRDPFWLRAVQNEAGIPTLQVVRNNAECTGGISWLRKLHASGGGHGIDFVNKVDACQNEKYYYQQYQPGKVQSALFISTDISCSCIGVCLNISGDENLFDRAFQFIGNIGPIIISNQMEDWLCLVSGLLSKLTTLRGIWGIDFVERNGRFYLLEVNPRYTSSVEVYERSTGRSLVQEMLTKTIHELIKMPSSMVGKAIYYSTTDHCLTTQDLDIIIGSTTNNVELVDIPAVNTSFRRGDPILTVLVHGETAQDCHDKLTAEKTRISMLLAHLKGFVPC